jgi:hypothetical protein
VQAVRHVMAKLGSHLWEAIRFGFQPWNAAVVRSGCICWAHGGGTRKRASNPTRIANGVNGVPFRFLFGDRQRKVGNGPTSCKLERSTELTRRVMTMSQVMPHHRRR